MIDRLEEALPAREDPSGLRRMIALMQRGDTVIYVGCGHVDDDGNPDPCPELTRPCSVALWGSLEIVGFSGGNLLCSSAGGNAELFAPHEVDTPEAVARFAVARQTGEEAK